MNIEATYKLLYTWLAATARRLRDDERGSATAQEIVLIAAAIIGAAAVGVIIWSRLRSGAEQIQVPAP